MHNMIEKNWKPSKKSMCIMLYATIALFIIVVVLYAIGVLSGWKTITAAILLPVSLLAIILERNKHDERGENS